MYKTAKIFVTINFLLFLMTMYPAIGELYDSGEPEIQYNQNFCPTVALSYVQSECSNCYQTKSCATDEKCIRANCWLSKCMGCGGEYSSEKCDRYAISCGSPDDNSPPDITITQVPDINPNPPPDDGDGGWVLVVGGLAALAAAAIAAIRKMQGKPKKEGEKPRTTYILQLSKNEVSVSTKKTDSFYAKAWIVDETGQYTPASSALLSVSVSSPVDGLAFSPASGMGEISVTISLSKPINVKTATLNVKGQVGVSSISGSVTVHIEPELQVGFE